MLLREATEITTVIFRGEKFQTSKFSSYPPELLWRHFHRWVKSFSGISREDQKFAKFDDYESTALRKFKDPKSELFQKIGGGTFKLLVSSRKHRPIVHWRFGHPPATIPTSGYFSRPLRKSDISEYGIVFQRNKEAPLLRLLPSAVGWCSPRMHACEQLKRKELRVAQLNMEFFSKAMILKCDKPPEDQNWRKLLQPQASVPEKFSVRVEVDGRSLVWTVGRGREFSQITNRSGKDPSQTIILLNGFERTGDRKIFPNDTVTCKALVAPPEAGPAVASALAEASAFSIFVKSSGEPEAWTLREGHEWEDFNRRVRDQLKFENFSASFNSRVWTESSQPPSANQTVTVSPRLRKGALKKKKEVEWDPELKEKVLGVILSSDYDWATKAKLSPAQLKANEKVLDALETLSRLESGPLHIGHIIRTLEDETAVPFPNPGIQVQQKLGRDLTIKDVLMRLPISLWPPAYHSQCFHPECGMSKAQMCKTDHQNKAHNRKRDFINSVYQKLNGSYLFDGESCLTATTAIPLNVTVIAPLKANYSDAYKVGMGIEKQLNTIGDLQDTWL
jgi:hypothetical protein